MDYKNSEARLLEHIFSPACDTVTCPTCGTETEITNRFCPYCGTANLFYDAVIPLLTEEQKETVVSDGECDPRWHEREMHQFDPDWIFCPNCGKRVGQAH